MTSNKVRQERSLVGGEKDKFRLVKKTRVSTATIEPGKVDWVKRTAGIASGIYGNVDEYIEKERASWDKYKK